MYRFLCLISLISASLYAEVSYSESGVSSQEADQLVSAMGPLARSTARPGADPALGDFGGFFDLGALGYQDPILVSGTDGVGTKLLIAQQVGKHDTIGIDLVAMSVNDILVHGAEPLFFLDYFATGKLKMEEAIELMKGITKGCRESRCALIGGETAQMPALYRDGEYDLAGFAVGIVERHHLLPKKEEIKPGDCVIGIASSGIHSNGFSLIHSILEKNKIDLNNPPPFPSERAHLYEVLLEPTLLYVQDLLPLIKEGRIKALAHITGGGLVENIPRVLPDEVKVELESHLWEIPPLFTWVAQMGPVELSEMYTTFNMGIGMVLIAAPEECDALLERISHKGWKIGRVEERKGDEAQVLVR